MIAIKSQACPPGGSWGVALIYLLTVLSCHCRVMLDSVTHSTFLPNTSFCDPLMSWTDLFSNEEYYPAFEHQTGAYIQTNPSELGRAGAGGGSGLQEAPRPLWEPENANSRRCSGQRMGGGLGSRKAASAEAKAPKSSFRPPPSPVALGDSTNVFKPHFANRW